MDGIHVMPVVGKGFLCLYTRQAQSISEWLKTYLRFDALCSGDKKNLLTTDAMLLFFYHLHIV